MKLFPTTLLVIGVTLLLQANAFSQVNLPKNDASTAALVELCKNLDDVDGQNFCFGFIKPILLTVIQHANQVFASQRKLAQERPSSKNF
jgi:hypothetical protein